MQHLEQNDLLSEKQFAYRKNRLTNTAAHQVIDSIITSIDDKYKTAGIFCDLTKAFDVIQVDLLLEKLKLYGIRKNAHQLLESFLTGRKQIVQVISDGRKIRSQAGNLTIGIPQGSALGNTLFLTFINDLAHSISEGLAVLFADDTTVIVNARTYDQLSKKVNKTHVQFRLWNGLPILCTRS
ncbi:hypothetical protein O0L34_g19287 [Tuta absoluta]|nr:hypothetical protein O0L34_g19287 [Tuta absoluta]